MGCLSIIVLGTLSAALPFFFGYDLWVMILLAALWLSAIVASFIWGHRGFGGGGNVDLNLTVAGAAITAALLIPKYAEHTPCGQAKGTLKELAKAEADYFVVHKTYTVDTARLNLKRNPKVILTMLRGDEQSFMASASHAACTKEKKGTSKVYYWDSARGGLQQ